MYKKLIEDQLKEVVRDLGFPKPTDTLLSIPENSKFGDYSSNISLQLANQKTKNSYQSSHEIANAILEKLGHPHFLERIEIAGPGFLNFFLSEKALTSVILNLFQDLKKEMPKQVRHDKKKYLVEYAHPNSHKAFHIGHLRNISTGESIARLLESQGDEVFRVTYGGDIGPHVAKAIWGIQQLKDEYELIKTKSIREKAEFLGKAYAFGSQSYEEKDESKKEIDQINQKLYAQDPELKELWLETKEWSVGYFETIYSKVGTLFDAQIWESEIQELGVLLVKENLGRVFIEDDGAIIFPGEKYGLHNRVFITKAGYPTYEGKELGLTRRETEIFPYDKSLHVVANEQESFFEVTTKAIEMIDPVLTGKKEHLSYGMVNLSTGKMSSRKGEVITAEYLIEQVQSAILNAFSSDKQNLNDSLEKIAIGAVKFFFLKHSLKSDIGFDINQSISLQGDTGPYLQYTFARIHSLLDRATKNLGNLGSKPEENIRNAQEKTPSDVIAIRHQPEKQSHGLKDNKEIATSFGDRRTPRNDDIDKLEIEEREVLRELEYFDTIVTLSAKEFKPNELCLYLLNLAKAFNLFYEKCPILGSDKGQLRIALAKKVGETVKHGLYLLGIETVERM